MQRAKGDQSQGPVQRSSFRRSRELAKERAAADAAKLSELAAEDAQLRRGRGLSSLYNTKVRHSQHSARSAPTHTQFQVWQQLSATATRLPNCRPKTQP